MPEPCNTVYPVKIPDGCVLYYDMQDRTNKIIDHSGLGNHGTAVGTMGVTGYSGLERRFDELDDKIAAGNVSNLQFSTAFSFVMWLKRKDLASNQFLFGKYKTTDNTRSYGLFWQGLPSTMNFVVSKDGTSNDGSLTQLLEPSQSISSASTYYMVAGTYQYVTDGTSLMRLYVNGNLVASTNVAVGPIFNSPNALCIGTRSSNDWFFGGNIGHFSLYNRMLSRIEIGQLYRADAWRYGLPG